MRATAALLILGVTARPGFAQSEDRPRCFFEGKSVILKLDLTGAEEGVDVYPETAMPIDFPQARQLYTKASKSFYRPSCCTPVSWTRRQPGRRSL